MTSKLLSILFFLLAAFIACDKPDDEPIVQPIPKIKQMIFYLNDSVTGTKTFEYDLQGRLIKATGSDGYSETYIHGPGKVTREIVYPFNNETDISHFILNAQGLATNADGYEYNQQGYLTRWNTRSEFKYTISNGNTVALEIWTDNHGTAQLSYFYNYTFLTDRLNTIGNANTGITWLGTQDKNLVSREIYNDPIRSIELSFSYTYEFDAQNRVAKSASTYWPGRSTKYIYVE